MSKIPVAHETFTSANILSVTVGTNCPAGGDTGHGGRTIFRINNEAGTDLRISIDGGSFQDVNSFEIVLGGDTECATFIDALEFALKTLKTQIAANSIVRDEVIIE